MLELRAALLRAEVSPGTALLIDCVEKGNELQRGLDKEENYLGCYQSGSCYKKREKVFCG